MSPVKKLAWANQKGFTLIEVVIVLAIMGIIGGLLVGIFWQSGVLFGRVGADQVTLSDLRNITNWLFEDGSQAQVFEVKAEPNYIGFDWTDFTQAPGTFHWVNDRYKSDETGVFRDLSIDGEASNPQSVARKISCYDDIRFQRTDDYFEVRMKSTSDVALEPRSIGTDLLVQPRPGEVEEAPAGGYAIFVNGPGSQLVHWSGSDSRVLGNIYVNGEISVSGSDNLVSGTVEAVDAITVGGSRNFLDSRNSSAPVRTFTSGLVLPGNGSPTGITVTPLTDPPSLWVVNEEADKVFRYTLAGLPLGSFPLEEANTQPVGITSDGTSLWVLDKGTLTVYRYNLSGQLQDSFTLTTPSDNVEVEGITTNGTDLWVLDRGPCDIDEPDFVGRVFKYDLSGAFLGQAFFLDSQQRYATGIATDGSSLWVADKELDKVFRYTLTGTLQSSFSAAPATTPTGITTDGTSIWVVDADSAGIHKFAIDGGPATSPSPSDPILFPRVFTPEQFEPFTFDFQGDVQLSNVDEVWLDPDRSVLKPGVYHATGRIKLSSSNVIGNVTFIAEEVEISGSAIDVRLSPFHDTGVLFFATGSGDNIIKISGSNVQWTGILYAPDGEIELSGSNLLGDGALYANNLKWTGSHGRMAFAWNLFEGEP